VTRRGHVPSHLTVGVRAAFELHSSRPVVFSQRVDNLAVFNPSRRTAVPTGEAHRLPKKVRGFYRRDGGKSRPATIKSLPARYFLVEPDQAIDGVAYGGFQETPGDGLFQRAEALGFRGRAPAPSRVSPATQVVYAAFIASRERNRIEKPAGGTLCCCEARPVSLYLHSPP
jgi:hypothetical protein